MANIWIFSYQIWHFHSLGTAKIIYQSNILGLRMGKKVSNLGCQDDFPIEPALNFPVLRYYEMFGIYYKIGRETVFWIWFTLSVFLIFTIPVAATVFLMVSRIGRKWSTSNAVIRTIRDTMKLTAAAVSGISGGWIDPLPNFYLWKQ